MKEYKKQDRIIFKIFAIVFSALFFIIIINTIFFNKTIQVNFSPLIMIIGTLVVYGVIYEIYRILKKYPKELKIKNEYKIIIGLIIFLIQLLIAYLVYAHCGWDCGEVVQNAFSLYKGENISAWYFATYPNNIALLLIWKYVYVIVGLFQEIEPTQQSTFWIAIVFNIIMIDIGAIFTYLTSKKILGNKITGLSIIFILLFIVFFPFILVPYTDTMTLWIPIAIYYFYLKIKESTKMKYLYAFIEGILLVGGYLLKPTCIIVAIAICLVEILSLKIHKDEILKNAKSGAIMIIIFVLGLGITSVTYNQLKEKNMSKYISEEEFEQKSIPPTHFLMMGMQSSELSDNRGKNNTMYGAFSGEDVANTTQIDGKKAKKEFNIATIKQRLKDYGIFGYFKFVYNKMNWILSDGTFYYGGEGHFFATPPYNQTILGKSVQKYFDVNSNQFQNITANILQISWVTLFIGIIATYKNREKEFNILKFSIIGIILFIILFEGRSRYLYNYVPMFLLLGVLGIRNIMEIKKIKFLQLSTQNKKGM